MSQTGTARKPLTVSLMFGPHGGVFEFTIDTSDETGLVHTLNEIIRLANAASAAEIATLKKRVLSTEETQRFIDLLKSHPNSVRFDGQMTEDDRLVARLEQMLKA